MDPVELPLVDWPSNKTLEPASAAAAIAAQRQ